MNRRDVQGLVFSGYRALPRSLTVLLEFGSGDARGFLRRLLPGVTSANERTELARNVAFTAPGLRALGVAPGTLGAFSEEFRQGMAEARRAERLGDVGEDAPAHWEFGGGATPSDAVLLIYAKDRARLAEERSELEQRLRRFALGARLIETYLPEDGREHFGFRMGVSEPGLTRREQRRGRERIPLGEVLLGYRNAFGETTPFPSAPSVRSTRDFGVRLGERQVALGRNGSYLVIRKIEQRIAQFEHFLKEGADRTAELSALAARTIGRWPNGAPLALQGEAPPHGVSHVERPFGYGDDPNGARCPLDSHVRSVNPRDLLGARANAHRLLRRGRLYGPTALESSAEERGLLFMALNADLARQFETVQASFVRGLGGIGAQSPGDALLARGREAGFLRVRGGLYAFLPSISALSYLAELRRG